MSKTRPSSCLSKHFHPSRQEAGYCDWLFARKKAGEIRSYRPWPMVHLRLKGRLWRKWKIDFAVEENDGTTSYHESKGWNRSDEVFRAKRDAFLLCYPRIKLYINKVLYTGKPARKHFQWTASLVKKINKQNRSPLGSGLGAVNLL